MSVLLPAPFSPMRAWTSPRRTVKSTPCRALTPGKLFARPRISRSVFWSVAIYRLPESILPVRQFRRGLRLVIDAFLDFDALGQRLLRHHVIHRIEELRSDERVAFHGAVQLPR